MMKCGVFIERDIEIIITDRYMIIYRRNNDEDFLESRLYKRENSNWCCIGICRSCPVCSVQRKPPEIWRHAFVYNGKIHSSDGDMKHMIGTAPVLIKQNENLLQINFEDSITYTAACDEVFLAETLSPAIPEITDDNIGDCLRLWNIGLKEEIIDLNGVPTFIGITVNTEKHMYIFEMTPDSIYCRAARYTATNKGVVFNQNFRQGIEAYMVEDNNIAGQPLLINEEIFSTDSCIWNDRSVYWSVKSYDSNCVILNGCQGDMYQWHKPQL